MKTLIVEDDPISSLLLHKIMVQFGTADTAENGKSAFEQFDSAWQTNTPYDLICLDIMLPDIDGQEILKRLRKRETQRGIEGLDGAKIVMITALGDKTSIFEAFRSQCEGYIIKPIRKDKVVDQLRALGLLS